MSESPSLSRGITSLRIGVKRLKQRFNAQQHEQAERNFAPLRKKTLAQNKGRCIYCGFSAPFNEVHGKNLDPYDMGDDNLVVACALCLPYHCVGDAPRKKQLTELDAGHVQNLAKMIHIPPSLGLSAQDVNHLQRALALALTDKNEKENAQKVYAALNSEAIVEQMTVLFETQLPTDFGRALNALTHDEFDQRNQHVEGLRMVYDQRYLEHLGRQLRNNTKTPLVDPSRWEELLERFLKSVGLIAPDPVTQEQGVGLDNLELDDNSTPQAQTPSGHNNNSPVGAALNMVNDAFTTALE